MFVSGFTFVRNAIRFDYPVEASIRSLLPLVDELIVCLGNSDDGTAALIDSIGDPKIKVIHSTWDDGLREGGKVLAVETNKAMDAVSTHADWCIYLQADEVIHEDDYPAIRSSMNEHLSNQQVEGLLFDYLHFYGAFKYIGASRKWYRREIRIVRNDPKIRSFRDAQGFRKNNRLMNVKLCNARIFHYGWVKNPIRQLEKQKNFHRLWHDDQTAQKKSGQQPFDYSEIDALNLFADTHPASMKARIANQDWEFEFDTSKQRLKFKDRLLMWIEKYTGKRLFEYKNYRII